MAPTVESIENNNVAVRTKAHYNSTIFGFVMWLYNKRDTYEGYLRDEVVEQLQAVLFDTSINIRKRKNKIEMDSSGAVVPKNVKAAAGKLPCLDE